MSQFLCLIFVLTFSFAALGDANVYSEGTHFAGIETKYDTEAFLGLPYAQPPVGQLRWKAPRKVRLAPSYKAKSLPKPCAQVGNMFANVPPEQFGKPVGSEDCLYLNIWRPQQASAQKRPVFFWIHGGSNTKGAANDPNYDGAFFAQKNDAVFVSVSYRLGLFASFLHPSLKNGNTLDDSGNYVTLDLIEALKWVHTHIEQFGGDPDNIIIAGQSAGCMNVWGLLQSPLAKNLFNGAICSAGMPNAYPPMVVEKRSENLLFDLLIADSLVKNTDEAQAYVKRTGPQTMRKYLLKKTPEELLAIPRFIVPTQHVTDGVVIPREGLAGVLLGNYNRVPLIMGATSDEATYFAGLAMFEPTEIELYKMLNDGKQYSKSDIIKSGYVPTYNTVIKASSLSMSATLAGIAQSLRLTNQAIYKYEFTWKDTPAPWNEVFKSFHGLDAIFYLGNFVEDRPGFSRFAWNSANKESRETLRETMSHYFKSFLHHGNPNMGHHLEEWPSYSESSEVIKF